MKRWMEFTAAFVVAAASGVWAAEPASPSPSEKVQEKQAAAEKAKAAAAIVGTWRVIAQRDGGRDVDPNKRPEIVYAFNADRTLPVKFSKPDGTVLVEARWCYVLDLDSSPPRIGVFEKAAPGDPKEEPSEWFTFEIYKGELTLTSVVPFEELQAAQAEGAPVPPAVIHEIVFTRLPAK